MDTRGFDEDNVKGRNAKVFLKKRIEKGGKLMLRRNNPTRYNGHDRDEAKTEKELLNQFVKQLQTN